MSGDARHLYVHLPFCAHRCGYCDFVTVVGRTAQHGAYVDALLAELAVERGLLAPELDLPSKSGRDREGQQAHACFLPVSDVDSAAMKASCGTSTRPTIFIRFLPSFCFSSSLRLRVMSPP